MQAFFTTLSEMRIMVPVCFVMVFFHGADRPQNRL